MLVGELLTFTRSAVDEAGRLRFQQTFGTARCESCDGLKAGPGVEATCFQVKRCYYSNIKAVDVEVRQARVIDNLLKPK